MLERLLISAALVLLGTGGFFVFRLDHLRRAGRATAAAALPAGKPALLYFRSDACAPCVAQARFVQQLQTQFGDAIVVEKVDADKDQAVAVRYGVFTLPTTLIVDRSGQVRHANYGLTDARRLASQLNGLN
jgi:thiol-disulfide isomerase/thioredoxin